MITSNIIFLWSFVSFLFSQRLVRPPPQDAHPEDPSSLLTSGAAKEEDAVHIASVLKISSVPLVIRYPLPIAVTAE